MGCNQKSPPDSVTHGICQGWQVGGFSVNPRQADTLPVLSPNMFTPPALDHPTLERAWGVALLWGSQSQSRKLHPQPFTFIWHHCWAEHRVDTKDILFTPGVAPVKAWIEFSRGTTVHHFTQERNVHLGHRLASFPCRGPVEDSVPMKDCLALGVLQKQGRINSPFF